MLVIGSMLLSACGAADSTATAVPPAATATKAAAPAATATTATTGGATATSAPVADTPVPAAGKGIMTISVAQQSTWVRNFNPFSGDFRFPTVNGIYEPMMIYNTVKGELQPWLATKYEWSADNKTLTITLRNDVKWSDGQAFTAKDVAFTFNLFKTTDGLQGPGGQAMNGATAYVDTVAAPSDTSVVFTFKQVFTPGLYDIIAQDIVPEHIWKDIKDPVKVDQREPCRHRSFHRGQAVREPDL